jgi:hypothetical protein
MKTLPAEFSYNQVIINKSHNPINFELTRDLTLWPKQIHILEQKDVEALDVSRLQQHSLSPKSAYGAALSEILVKQLDSAQVISVMNFWWLNHEKILAYMIHKDRWQTNLEYLVYNATWCKIGYSTNQSKKVKELVRDVYFDGAFKRTQYLDRTACLT